jgi:hypothetical protein
MVVTWSVVAYMNWCGGRSFWYVRVTRATEFVTGETALLNVSNSSELGLDRGKRRDELGQVMYIGVSQQIRQ